MSCTCDFSTDLLEFLPFFFARCPVSYCNVDVRVYARETKYELQTKEERYEIKRARGHKTGKLLKINSNSDGFFVVSCAQTQKITMLRYYIHTLRSGRRSKPIPLLAFSEGQRQAASQLQVMASLLLALAHTKQSNGHRSS